MKRRVATLAAAIVLALIVGYIDAAPWQVLCALAALAVGVYVMFLAVVNRKPRLEPCACRHCSAEVL